MSRVSRAVAMGVVAAVTGGLLLALPAQATNIGNEGCTPGYWKNHTTNWEEIAPTTTIGSRGWIAPDSALAGYTSWTFLQALQGGGGPGLDGAARILLRAASAAYLNAAHEGVGYPYRRAAMRPLLQAAFASGDRATMLALASQLDDANNLGCPLH